MRDLIHSLKNSDKMPNKELHKLGKMPSWRDHPPILPVEENLTNNAPTTRFVSNWRSKETKDEQDLNYNWRDKSSVTSETIKDNFKIASPKEAQDTPLLKQLKQVTIVEEKQVALAQKYTYVLPMPGEVHKTEAVFLENCDNFFVQLIENIEEIENVMSEIDEYINNLPQTPPTFNNQYQPGTPCLAKFQEDQRWYRGQIEPGENSENVRIYFVDYGNTEDISKEEVIPIPLEFSKLPAQAVHVRLAGAKPERSSTWVVEDLHHLQDCIERKQLTTLFLTWDRSYSPNGIYDIIFYEENQEAINCHFGVNLDQLQLLSRPQYLETILDENLEINATVSWFISPTRMYCQDKASIHNIEIINKLLEKYSEFCTREFNGTLKIGQNVIARFSEDGALYRAEIRQIFENGEILVLYVDFGNSEKVSKSRVWPLFDPQLMKIPKQAFRASLFNIKPPEGHTKWSSGNNIERIISKGIMKCLIKDDSSRVYKIELYNKNGNNVSDILVSKGLASYEFPPHQDNTLSESNFTHPENEPIYSHSEMETIYTQFENESTAYCEKEESTYSQSGIEPISSEFDDTQQEIEPEPTQISNSLPVLEPIPLNLLVGEILPIHVTYINTEMDFYIHINPSYSLELQNRIDEFVSQPKNLNKLEPTNLKEGDMILATYDSETWYRAIITDLTKETIHFCDYGDYSSLKDVQIANITDALKIYPPQATLSCLVGIEDSIQERIDQINQIIDFLAIVKTVKNNGLELFLLNKEGDYLEWIPKVAGIEKPINSVVPLPLIAQNIEVKISYVQDEKTIWIQYLNDSLNKINQQLLEESSELCPLEETSTLGTLCCVKTGNDLFRAKILGLEENYFKVKLIDYGKEEYISKDNIFLLPKTAYSHELSRHVILEYSNSKEDLIDNKTRWFVKFIRNLEGFCLVDLRHDNESFQDFYMPKIEPPLLEIDKRCAVTISHIDSPIQFYIQMKDKEDELEKLQEILNLNIERMKEWSGDENQLVAALYENEWFRAKFLPECSLLHFIDYGNAIEIDSCTNMRVLSETLSIIPPLALRCCLEEYNSELESYIPDSVIDNFVESVQIEEIFCTLKKSSMEGQLVNLFDTNNTLIKINVNNEQEKIEALEEVIPNEAITEENVKETHLNDYEQLCEQENDARKEYGTCKTNVEGLTEDFENNEKKNNYDNIINQENDIEILEKVEFIKENDIDILEKEEFIKKSDEVKPIGKKEEDEICFEEVQSHFEDAEIEIEFAEKPNDFGGEVNIKEDDIIKQNEDREEIVFEKENQEKIIEEEMEDLNHHEKDDVKDEEINTVIFEEREKAPTTDRKEDQEVAEIMSNRHPYDHSERIVPGAITFFSLNGSPVHYEEEDLNPRATSLPIIPTPTPAPRRRFVDQSPEKSGIERPKPLPRTPVRVAARIFSPRE